MDNVNHPQHYKGKNLECIQFIEAFDLGFHLGNVVKYVLRAGNKGDSRIDLAKARWYLNRAIDNNKMAKCMEPLEWPDPIVL